MKLEPNDEGWYQREEITASKGFISNEGVLSTEHCSDEDTTLCNVTEITLDNIANTATTYHRQSNFLKDNFLLKMLQMVVLLFMHGMQEIGETTKIMMLLIGKTIEQENVEEQMMFSSK